MEQQEGKIFQTLDQVEKDHIMHVLAEVNGNKATAAKTLGISIKTLYNKLERYGVHVRNEQKKDGQ